MTTLMTEQIHDQTSAFVDDELLPEECAFFVRRLERDAETRAKLVRYMAAGSVLRNEALMADPDLLRRRIGACLDGVTAAAPRMPRRRGLAGFVKPLVGTGIAASVALAALVALRGTGELTSEGVPAAPLQATQSTDVSYVVPQELPIGAAVSPPIRYTNYLMHHGEYASGLNRTLVRSNVVSTREADIAVEGEAAFE